MHCRCHVASTMPCFLLVNATGNKRSVYVHESRSIMLAVFADFLKAVPNLSSGHVDVMPFLWGLWAYDTKMGGLC